MGLRATSALVYTVRFAKVGLVPQSKVLLRCHWEVAYMLNYQKAVADDSGSNTLSAGSGSPRPKQMIEMSSTSGHSRKLRDPIMEEK